MLNVQSIDLHYGNSQALWNVSLGCAPGRITCLLGRNGVGKTSTIRAIVGQHPVTSGAVNFEGKDITKEPAFARARHGISLVPQGREIFPLLTVKENLQTGLSVVAPKDRTIPDQVFELFPVLKSMLGRRGGDLSGGQQQQLAIGRALVMRPKLIVLDEPTEGIQPSIIKDIAKVLELLRDQLGLAVLLIEQYFEFARDLADEIMVMDRGQIVLQGRAADLDEAEVRSHLTV
ncbi:MAG: urea ABC transporter ATP-binding subunit UrtE [Pseudomonadota bacterium]